MTVLAQTKLWKERDRVGLGSELSGKVRTAEP